MTIPHQREENSTSHRKYNICIKCCKNEYYSGHMGMCYQCLEKDPERDKILWYWNPKESRRVYRDLKRNPVLVKMGFAQLVRIIDTLNKRKFECDQMGYQEERHLLESIVADLRIQRDKWQKQNLPSKRTKIIQDRFRRDNKKR